MTDQGPTPPPAAPPPTGPPAAAAPPPTGPPAAGSPAGNWSAVPPPMLARDRVRAAWWRRAETDYLFSYWSALGWTILTIGIYSVYVFYQLVRRMRDHNARRLELFDAALTVAWEQAGQRGLQDELTPSFHRAAAHMAVLRQMTTDFREPVVWVVLALIARGIAELVAFVLLDQDLVRHDQAEVGVEYELALIYGRLGQSVPAPDQSRVKGRDNYVGRIVATIFTLGVYLFWWYYNQMVVPNRHFLGNWPQEDALAQAVEALSV